jgi:hypothetical protein
MSLVQCPTPAGSSDAGHLLDGMPDSVAAAGEDRIGALPDDILRLVLSFLPSRESVCTCVRARSPLARATSGYPCPPCSSTMKKRPGLSLPCSSSATECLSKNSCSRPSSLRVRHHKTLKCGSGTPRRAMLGCFGLMWSHMIPLRVCGYPT